MKRSSSAVKKNMNKSLSGRTVFFYVLIFFGIFIAVDMAFLVTALRNHPGVVSDNAYVEGLEYNKTIAKRKTQKELGWSGEILLDKKGDLTEFKFIFKDQKGRPIPNAKILVTAKRPTNAGSDFSFELDSLGRGQYSKKITFSQAGQWDIYLTTEYVGEQFELTKRVLIEK